MKRSLFFKMHIVVISCFLFVCGIVDANHNEPLELIGEFPTLSQDYGWQKNDNNDHRHHSDLSKPVEPYASKPIHYEGHAKVQQPNKQVPNLKSRNAKVALPGTSNNYKYVPTFEIEYSYLDDDDSLASEDNPYFASRLDNYLQQQLSNPVLLPTLDLNTTQNVVSRNDQSPVTANKFPMQSLNADTKVPSTVSEEPSMEAKNILSKLLLYLASENPLSHSIVPTTEFAVPKAIIMDKGPSSTFSQHPVNSQLDNMNYVLKTTETSEPPHVDDFNGVQIADQGLWSVHNSRDPVENLSQNEQKYTLVDENPIVKNSNFIILLQTLSKDVLPKSTKAVGSQSDNMSYTLNAPETNETAPDYDLNTIQMADQGTWNKPNTLISGENFSEIERKYTLVEKTPIEKKPEYIILVGPPSKDELPKSTKVVEDHIAVEPSTEKDNVPESKAIRNALLDIIYIADKLPSNQKINQKEVKPSAETYRANQSLLDVEYIKPSEKGAQATNTATLDIILNI